MRVFATFRKYQTLTTLLNSIHNNLLKNPNKIWYIKQNFTEVVWITTNYIQVSSASRSSPQTSTIQELSTSIPEHAARDPTTPSTLSMGRPKSASVIYQLDPATDNYQPREYGSKNAQWPVRRERLQIVLCANKLGTIIWHASCHYHFPLHKLLRVLASHTLSQVQFATTTSIQFHNRQWSNTCVKVNHKIHIHQNLSNF
jgi:hypothetical protein